LPTAQPERHDFRNAFHVPPVQSEVCLSYDLEVRLALDGRLQDVLLDGQSLWPTWFKVEWKGNGQLGAKIAGRRLSTREGDSIRFTLADEVVPAESRALRREPRLVD